MSGRNLLTKELGIIRLERENVHTGNVNVSLNEYILSCLAEGQVGGETILVSAKNVYETKKKF